MPTCPRCALLAVVFAALAVAGCDSNNPGRDLALIEGSYQAAEITFRPDASAIADVDVDADLDPGTTRLQIFGADREALFVIKPLGGPSRRVDLNVSASRGRAVLEAPTEGDVADLATILLPAQLTLAYDVDTGGRLTGTARQTVDLQAYDRQAYGGLTSVPGVLTVRFVRL